MKTIELRNGAFSAAIAPLGAELRQLAFAGREMIWEPDPELWDGTASVLFPTIGKVVGDVIRVDGEEFPMPMHGFALTSTFATVDTGTDFCTLELRADETSRRHYPFDFVLRLTYRLTAQALAITAEITNDGARVMPASLGLHPGFRWPLVPGIAKERHMLTFAEPGSVSYTRPIDRLVGPDRFDLPLEDQAFRLRESLFETSGLALLSLEKRSIRYHTEDGRAGIRIDFPDIDRVIVWSRPGGNFLCIEPLLGHADPIGFTGDIMEKPGMAHIQPGETLKLSVTITPEFLPA